MKWTYDPALWLRFADRLDAYMTAKRAGAPMRGDGWPECREWLIFAAGELGVADDVAGEIDG